MATAEELIGRSLGPYRLVEEVGKGGMAVVFKAEEEGLGREVALKVLSTDFTQDVRALERFEREAQTTASLDHPNIIKIYGIGEEDGLHYFAMEFLPYRSLHDIIKDEGKLPIERAVDVVVKALRGLGAAHAAGVIHRDLKPENIMMNSDGDPILVDFGIAKTGKGNRLTQTGVLLGTPYYMSPEQITGKEVQVQSDLYSMGVVLYELLTAEVPFQADSTFMITYKHCTEAPPPPRKLNDQISEDLQLVVLKSLEKDLRKRYQDANEFADDLNQVMGGGKVEIEVTRKRDIFELPDYKEAMEHFRDKRFSDARECFQKVVDDVPDPEFAAEANRMVASCFSEELDFVTSYRIHKLTEQRWPDTAQAKGVPIHLDGCLFQQVQLGERNLLEHGRLAALRTFRAMLALLDELDVPQEERQESHWIQQLEARATQIATEIRRIRILKRTALAVSVGGTIGCIALFVWFRFVDPFAGHLLAARYEALRGRPDGVLKEYGLALALQPDNVPTLVRLGEAHLALGQGEEARANLNRAIELDSSEPMAHELLGQMDLALGALETAEDHLRRAVENAPDRPEAWAKFGLVKGRLGQVEEELEYYQKAIDLDRRYLEARVYKAQAQWKRQEAPLDALTTLREAVAIQKDHAPSYHAMGEILLSLGKSEAAQEAFLEALRHDPSDPETHYNLAVIYSKGGFREKATKELEDALRFAKSRGAATDRIHYLLGQIREGVAETREGEEAAELRGQAEQHYKEAVAQAPQVAAYPRRLGFFYWNLGNWGHAADAWGRWSRLEPRDPEPAFRIGQCLLRADRPEDALEPLERSTALAPDRPEYAHHLGLALKRVGQADRAEASWERLLRRSPDYVPTLIALASLRLEARRPRDAVPQAQELLRVAGGDPDALEVAGQVLLGAGDLAGGERALRSALEADPEHLKSLNGLGRLLLATQRTAEGIRLLEQSLAISPLQGDAAALKKELAKAGGSR